MVKFRCAACGQKLGVADEHAGKRVKCSGCGVPVAVPAAAAADAGVGGLELDLPAAEPAVSPRPVAPAAGGEKVCPKCGAACGAAAGLCTTCGHSFKFGMNVQTVHKARSAAAFTGRTSFALAGGAVAAVLGAALWAGVVVATGYEIGWVAWGVGVLVGIVVAGVAQSTSPNVGMAAAGLALVGLLLGKLLIFQWGLPSIVAQEIETDPSLMRQAVALQMIEAGEAAEDLRDAIVTMISGGSADEHALAPVDTKLGAMSSDQKHTAAVGYAGRILAEVPMMERITTQLSFFDLLWGFLAVGTAFKIGAGAGGE